MRLWHVNAGGIPALALGPLAVAASHRKLGVGAALMKRALELAQARDHGAVILLGDVPYYARFGFSAFKTGNLLLPGPFERDRLLAVELREAALEGASGLIVPTALGYRERGDVAFGKLRGRCRARRERFSGRRCSFRERARETLSPQIPLEHFRF